MAGKKFNYDDTKAMLNTIHTVGSIGKLNEAEENDGDAIAITNDPKFGTNVLQGQIDAFHSAVSAGARFSAENPDSPKDNPLVYFPKTGNVVFSGTIPNLANMKFQISCNDITGAPYIFVDGLALTPQVADTLSRLAGFAKNFIEQWSSVADMLGTIKK